MAVPAELRLNGEGGREAGEEGAQVARRAVRGQPAAVAWAAEDAGRGPGVLQAAHIARLALDGLVAQEVRLAQEEPAAGAPGAALLLPVLLVAEVVGLLLAELLGQGRLEGFVVGLDAVEARVLHHLAHQAGGGAALRGRGRPLVVVVVVRGARLAVGAA